MNLLKSHLETIIFILFLIFVLSLILYYQIYDTLGIPSTITLFAVFVALGTGILTSFYNKNVLKQAKELNEKALNHAKNLNEKALLQSEKNLRIQLLFEESRKSLYYLKKSIESDFDIEKLKIFMDSSKAIYLPSNTKIVIKRSIKEIEEFERDAPWNPPEPTEEQWEEMLEEHYASEQAMINDFDNHELYNYNYQEKVRELESKIMNNLKNNLNKDPTEID